MAFCPPAERTQSRTACLRSGLTLRVSHEPLRAPGLVVRDDPRPAGSDPPVDSRRPPLRLHAAILLFIDTETTELYTLSLHDALPISPAASVDKAGDCRPG